MPGQASHRSLSSDEAFAVITVEAVENLDGDHAIQRSLYAPVHRAEAAASHLVGVMKPIVLFSSSEATGETTLRSGPAGSTFAISEA
ncbi:hypothetical protein W59_25886 [Rhodococcus opacus RKJ300 = JCM 13270]|uniref:Uncharacterized protein n=1 Tax=Rhodococcus opacus RKJ300 = JCM 13270 TaxID=1165867 RepID=I0WKV4_RHOOP|nr:hypothetical protein W59_25886 [Rhodococcus opacus RKJ300 = JCM 13270]